MSLRVHCTDKELDVMRRLHLQARQDERAPSVSTLSNCYLDDTCTSKRTVSPPGNFATVPVTDAPSRDTCSRLRVGI